VDRVASTDEARTDTASGDMLGPAWSLRWRAPELALLFAERAGGLAKLAGDGPDRLRAEATVVIASCRLGRRLTVVERAIAAVRSAERLSDAVTAALVRIELAGCARAAGVPLVGAATLRPVLTSDAVSPSVRADALVQLVECLTSLVDARVLDDALAEADRLYAEDGDVTVDGRVVHRALLRSVASAEQRRRGDARAAVQAAQEGADLLGGLRRASADNGAASAKVALRLVHGLLDLSRVDEAVAIAGAELARPVRAPAAMAVGWLGLALAVRKHLAEGAPVPALALLREVSELAERHRLGPLRAEALTTLSDAHERVGQLPEALDCLRTAQGVRLRRAREVYAARTKLVSAFGEMTGPGEFVELLGGSGVRRTAAGVGPGNDNASALLSRFGMRRPLAEPVTAGRNVAPHTDVTMLLVDLTAAGLIEEHALSQVLDRVRHAAPTEAQVARVGGAEFAVLLPSTQAGQTEHWVERFRGAIAEVDWAAVNPGIAVHVRVAVAQQTSGRAAEPVVAAGPQQPSESAFERPTVPRIPVAALVTEQSVERSSGRLPVVAAPASAASQQPVIEPTPRPTTGQWPANPWSTEPTFGQRAEQPRESAAGRLVAGHAAGQAEANRRAAAPRAGQLPPDELLGTQPRTGRVPASELLAARQQPGDLPPTGSRSGRVPASEIFAAQQAAGDMSPTSSRSGRVPASDILAAQQQGGDASRSGRVSADEIRTAQQSAGDASATSSRTGRVAASEILAAQQAAGAPRATPSRSGRVSADEILAAQQAAGAPRATPSRSGRVSADEIWAAQQPPRATPSQSGWVPAAEIQAAQQSAADPTWSSGIEQSGAPRTGRVPGSELLGAQSPTPPPATPPPAAPDLLGERTSGRLPIVQPPQQQSPSPFLPALPIPPPLEPERPVSSSPVFGPSMPISPDPSVRISADEISAAAALPPRPEPEPEPEPTPVPRDDPYRSPFADSPFAEPIGDPSEPSRPRHSVDPELGRSVLSSLGITTGATSGGGRRRAKEEQARADEPPPLRYQHPIPELPAQPSPQLSQPSPPPVPPQPIAAESDAERTSPLQPESQQAEPPAARTGRRRRSVQLADLLTEALMAYQSAQDSNDARNSPLGADPTSSLPGPTSLPEPLAGPVGLDPAVGDEPGYPGPARHGGDSPLGDFRWHTTRWEPSDE
jgi:hypothetical protein